MTTFPSGVVSAEVVIGAPIAQKPVREGDQQLPEINDRPDIQTQVIADIELRRQVGIQRYGTALQPFNGRDAAQDAYEEVLDLVMYWKQWLIERAELLAQLEAVTQERDQALLELAEERERFDHEMTQARGN
jgi:hypothetical protein